MWNPLVILVLCLCSFTYAVPLGLKKNMAIVQEEEEPMLMLAADEETRPEVMISRLNLPSNATSIRADITDGFSCDNKTYGYYADVENECQIFHVCLPVTYADGKENTFRWSFICPEETVFSQDSFTCMRPEDMSIDCEESFKYYELNRNFGVIESEESLVSAEEDMNMEELSRQPPNLDFAEDIRQTVVAAPVKKQTVKVQNSNRRKTQTNRITVEAQRKKVQPSRKTPQPVVPATSAKPVEEDVPMLEQEAERTTVKYQRFTKRPVTAIKEQPKPEAPKPEQQLVRQELYAQKRKRPQIFSATRLDTAVQTESESEPEASQKTDIVLEQQSAQGQAEAQASEIAEVSIKPMVEKIAELKPVAAEKSESVAAKEKEPALPVDQPSDLKSEIAPMPENIPSRAEVIEIPIQKVDEPLPAETPEAPLLEEPKPVADVMEPMKAEEEKLRKEQLLAEEAMQTELTKMMEKVQQQEAEKAILETPAEPEKPMDAEKVFFEPVPEPEIILEGNEPDNFLEAVKIAELPSEPEVPVSEPVKALETVVEPQVEAAEPEMLLNAEVPKPETEPAVPLKIAAPVAEPELEMPKEDERPIIEVPAPEPVVEVIAPIAELEKPLEAEAPVAEPETLLKVETPIAEPEKPLETVVPAPEPEMPLRLETPVPERPTVLEPEMPLRIETPVAEPEKPLEDEVPTADLEMTKNSNAMDTPIEPAEKPAEAEIPAEPMSILNPEPQMPLKAEQSEAQLEKSSEVQAEGEIQAQPQASAEEDSLPSASETEDAQSLILDFISSLVNSENSNLEEQNGGLSEMQSENTLEPAASESKLTEEKPVEALPEQEPQSPLYMPMMQNSDQMYQIPVQIIESPEPELPIPTPVVAQPKLPLSIDDVVELVKESLDTPAEKENLVQAPSADHPEPQPDSDEVKPIYHRYFELGSNLLKSEALTASDDEPIVISAANDNSMVQDEEPQPAIPMELSPMPELPKASEQLPEPEQLASEPEPALNSLPQADALESESASTSSTADRLAMSRSMNRFKMDPRKRRFLFRSDAS